MEYDYNNLDNVLQNDVVKSKSRNVFVDCDFVDQSTGAIIWHRRFNLISNNSATYKKKMVDLTESLIRSSEVGNYSLLLSVRRPSLNEQKLPF